MTTLDPRALEAAARAIAGQYWQTAMDDARAALRAALPHLTAQDVPHLIRQAKAEAWDEGYRASGIVYPILPPKHPTNPYAEETTDDHA